MNYCDNSRKVIRYIYNGDYRKLHDYINFDNMKNIHEKINYDCRSKLYKSTIILYILNNCVDINVVDKYGYNVSYYMKRFSKFKSFQQEYQ